MRRLRTPVVRHRRSAVGVLMGASALTLAWGTGAIDAAYRVWVARRALKPPDVVYIGTPQPVVEQMLEMAKVGPGDVVYDLGCGDGRVLVTAAKTYQVKGVGYDIDPVRVAEARENARGQGVAHLVSVHQGDIFEADLGEATVVTMFLLPHLNVLLKPKLARLRPGTRIVSHGWDMKGARPLAVEPVRQAVLENAKSVYLWVVPWQDEP